MFPGRLNRGAGRAETLMFSDDKLSAYLDGETTAAEAREIKEAAARIPEIARRLERLRRVSDAVSAAYGVIDDRPLPHEISTLLRADETPEERQNPVIGGMIRFPSRSDANTSRWSVPVAASLALLVGFGFGALAVSHLSESSQPGAAEHMAGIITPPNPMFAVLETQASGTAVALGKGGNVSAVPVLTFRAGSGAFCREYKVTSGQTLTHGLACRENGIWNIKALAALPVRPAAAPEWYTTASSDSSELFDGVVDRLKTGDPVSAEAERQLIGNEWN